MKSVHLTRNFGETEYDIIIAGGGPAGIGAAIAAGLLGRKVLLLEARGMLGGVAYNAFFMPFNRILLHGGTRSRIHQMLIDQLKSHGPGACVPGRTNAVDGDNLNIHSEYLRLSLLELLEKLHVDYLLYSPVVAARSENGNVLEVETAYKTVRRRYRAKQFIDCTGDGDLCFSAGAETCLGDPDTHRTMFITFGFMIAGVDTETFFKEIGTYQTKAQIQARIPESELSNFIYSPWYSFDWTTLPGVVSVNNGGWENVGIVNGTLPEDLTRAERGGIQVAHDFIRMARTYAFPGLEHCELDRVGAAPGIRETRRVLCDYVQTEEDAMRSDVPEDIVARRYGAMDFAGSDPDQKIISGYPFPYRALLVKGFDNLMVAGRCGSFTRKGLAAGKSMGNMLEIGAAAGAAAALAVSRKETLRSLPISVLQKQLRTWDFQI